MKNSLLVFIILFLLVLGCVSSSQNTSKPDDFKKLPIEEQLVLVDTQRIPEPNNIDVKRVRYLLDYLAARTTDSREDIGNAANKAVQSIENNVGRRYTRQQFLEASCTLIDQWEAAEKKKKGSKYEKPSYGIIAGSLIISAK